MHAPNSKSKRERVTFYVCVQARDRDDERK